MPCPVFYLGSLGQEHAPTVYKQPLEAASAREEVVVVGRKMREADVVHRLDS